MSSNPYAPLRIEPHASAALKRVVAAVCIGAVASLWLTPLPFSLRLLLSLIAVAATVRTWQKRPELGGAPVWVEWNREGEWYWHEAGHALPADLLGDTYLNSGLVILNFRTEGGRRSLVLPRDALDPVTFRRLKVRLRIEGMKPDEDFPMKKPAAESQRPNQ
ncbi:protein YgfX [Thiohalomonas denitrificans]|uniref:protein YgfX n=1 Tax=Thiohalomonas denitrificans TaxID=415747 RepID=UPI0026F2A770|nr:protein YgfX [Thiohalomonas denitrificans]